MKMFSVQSCANGYAVYYDKQYVLLFSRKENAEFELEQK